MDRISLVDISQADAKLDKTRPAAGSGKRRRDEDGGPQQHKKARLERSETLGNNSRALLSKPKAPKGLVSVNAVDHGKLTEDEKRKRRAERFKRPHELAQSLVATNRQVNTQNKTQTAEVPTDITPAQSRASQSSQLTCSQATINSGTASTSPNPIGPDSEHMLEKGAVREGTLTNVKLAANTEFTVPDQIREGPTPVHQLPSPPTSQEGSPKGKRKRSATDESHDVQPKRSKQGEKDIEDAQSRSKQLRAKIQLLKQRSHSRAAILMQDQPACRPNVKRGRPIISLDNEERIPHEESFPEDVLELFPYDDDASVSILLSAHIEHRHDPKKLEMHARWGEDELDERFLIELRQKALRLYRYGITSENLGRKYAPKKGPSRLIDDVDLYFRDDKVHVATERGLLLAADYIKLLGIPDTQPVHFEGTKPAWTRLVEARRCYRRVDEPYIVGEAMEKNGLLNLTSGSTVEVFETGVFMIMKLVGNLYLPLGNKSERFDPEIQKHYQIMAYGTRLEDGRTGWFPSEHTCRVNWGRDEPRVKTPGLIDWSIFKYDQVGKAPKSDAICVAKASKTIGSPASGGTPVTHVALTPPAQIKSPTAKRTQEPSLETASPKLTNKINSCTTDNVRYCTAEPEQTNPEASGGGMSTLSQTNIATKTAEAVVDQFEIEDTLPTISVTTEELLQTTAVVNSFASINKHENLPRHDSHDPTFELSDTHTTRIEPATPIHDSNDSDGNIEEQTPKGELRRADDGDVHTVVEMKEDVTLRYSTLSTPPPQDITQNISELHRQILPYPPEEPRYLLEDRVDYDDGPISDPYEAAEYPIGHGHD
ncbi:hypothetical protein ACN47E_001754 [Coniothyrium glycines]